MLSPRVLSMAPFLAVCLTVPVAFSLAAGEQGSRALELFPDSLISYVRNSKEKTLKHGMSLLDVSETGDRYIDSLTIEKVEREQYEKRHAGLAREALKFDPNADGKITERELRRRYTKQAVGAKSVGVDLDVNATVLRKINNFLVSYDFNGDRVVDGSDALAYADARIGLSDLADVLELQEVLNHDPDGDGRITAQELERMLSDLFDFYDKSGDATIDKTEYELVRRDAGIVEANKRNRPNYEQRQACNLPLPASQDQVVMLGTEVGEAISNIAVDGLDGLTTTGKLVIEPGAGPLYLYVTGWDSIIWQVEGAVHRISKMIVAPYKFRGENMGVIGVPTEKVHFLSAPGCFHAFNPGGKFAQDRAEYAMERKFRRELAPFISVRSFTHVSLPSGTVVSNWEDEGPGWPVRTAKTDEYLLKRGKSTSPLKDSPSAADPPPGVHQVDWYLFRAHFPNGVIDLTGEKVVTSGNAQPYDVLPSLAGIVQMSEQGKLEFADVGYHRIIGKLPRVPGGLRERWADFVMAKGVELPGGSPMSACIYKKRYRSAVQGWDLRCRYR